MNDPVRIGESITRGLSPFPFDEMGLSSSMLLRSDDMARKFTAAILGMTAWSLCAVTGLAADYVMESARNIPVAYEADVVVLGGSSGAVAAACEASAGGARG